MAASDWAIIVGIKRYPRLPPLEGPEADAQAFLEWVVKSPDGGAVPYDSKFPHDETKNHVLKIYSSDFHAADEPLDKAFNAKPEIGAVETPFNYLQEMGEDAKDKGAKPPYVGDRLYIYFSGHGCSLGKLVSLLLANATSNSLQHIPGLPYAEYFFDSGNFKQVILLMDCCQEKSRQPTSLRLPVYVNRHVGATRTGSFFYGYSSKWGTSTKEVPIGGKVRGVFTATLLDGLSGKACLPYSGGRITSNSLAQYLYDQMEHRFPEADLKNSEISKRPYIVYDTDPTAEFDIAKVPNPPKYLLTVHITPEAVGREIIVKRPDRKQFRVTATATRVPLEVERGLHEIRFAGSDVELGVEITGRDSADVELPGP